MNINCDIFSDKEYVRNDREKYELINDKNYKL